MNTEIIKVFTYRKPWDSETEFHIYLYRTYLGRNYKENHPNHNNLWDDVRLCLQKSEYNSIIESYNYDWNSKDKLYMFIYLRENNTSDVMNSIINLLNTTYQNEWILYCNMPKLSTLIVRKFNNIEFLINSICEDQRLYGYESTKSKTDYYLKYMKPIALQDLTYKNDDDDD